jgi:repressor LexA
MVKGYSMVDALIGDGDMVILKPVDVVANGDMVAAWLKLEEEATLKKIYYEESMIRLQPCNALMDPIIVAAENVEVHGKVVAVLRHAH